MNANISNFTYRLFSERQSCKAVLTYMESCRPKQTIKPLQRSGYRQEKRLDIYRLCFI